jgi:hypothetical protein
VAVATGCASDAPPKFARGNDIKTPPEGVDYLMAMQCSGLSAALNVFSSIYPDTYEADRLARAYANWALDRASADGGTWQVVRTDIEQSRKDFIAEAKASGDGDRAAYLMSRYGNSFRVCQSLADLPEYIVIGG